MTRLSFYKDLTKDQRAIYGNGCGPGLANLDKIIPEFRWQHACRRHDFNYDRGGTEEDRRESDNQFKVQMLNSIKGLSILQKIYYTPIIYTYYYAVRIGGYFAFSRGHYKNLPELIKFANKKYGIKL